MEFCIFFRTIPSIIHQFVSIYSVIILLRSIKTTTIFDFFEHWKFKIFSTDGLEGVKSISGFVSATENHVNWIYLENEWIHSDFTYVRKKYGSIQWRISILWRKCMHVFNKKKLNFSISFKHRIFSCNYRKTNFFAYTGRVFNLYVYSNCRSYETLLLYHFLRFRLNKEINWIKLYR